jgi:hypothetical protein
MKVRFLQTRVVQDGLQGTAHETRFSVDQVVDLPEASATHWLSRGVAERLVDIAPAEPASSEEQGGLDLPGGADQVEAPGEGTAEHAEGQGQAVEVAEPESRPAKSKAAAKA